jgi:hypothetical protein
MLFREIALDAIDAHGTLVQPMPGMPTMRGIKRVALRQHLIRRGFFTETEVLEDDKISRAAQTKEWNALNSLQVKKILGFVHDLVWRI